MLRYAVLFAGFCLFFPGCGDKSGDSTNNNAGAAEISSYENEKGDLNPDVVISGETLHVCLTNFGTQINVVFEQDGVPQANIGPIQVNDGCFYVDVPLGLRGHQTRLKAVDVVAPNAEDSVEFGLRRYVVGIGLQAGLLTYLIDDTPGPFPSEQFFIDHDSERTADWAMIHNRGKWLYVSSRLSGNNTDDLNVFYLPTMRQSDLAMNTGTVLDAALHPFEPVGFIPCIRGMDVRQLCTFDHEESPGTTFALNMTPAGNPDTIFGHISIAGDGSRLAITGPFRPLAEVKVWAAELDGGTITAEPVKAGCPSGSNDYVVNEAGPPVFVSDEVVVVPVVDLGDQNEVQVVDARQRCTMHLFPTSSQHIVGRRSPAHDFLAFDIISTNNDTQRLPILETGGGMPGQVYFATLNELVAGQYVGTHWVDAQTLMAWTVFESSSETSDVWLVDVSQDPPAVIHHFTDPDSVLEARVNPTNPELVYVASWANLKVCQFDVVSGWFNCEILHPGIVYHIVIQP